MSAGSAINGVFVQQAPALVWSHQCDQAVTFQTVLQAYCDKYSLHVQHASLTDSKGTAVNLSEVCGHLIAVTDMQCVIKRLNWGSVLFAQ